jgi:predicted phosphate transport protein (TIGR00153 family)
MSLRLSLYSVIGPSPIKPLQAHMKKVCQCAETLIVLFEAIFSKDWQKADEIHEQIVTMEKQADELKKEFRLKLHKDLYLSLPRSDLLAMLMLQDRIANRAKDIAGLVIGRKMDIPETLREPYMHFLKRSIDAALQAYQATRELNELLEAGFRGKEIEVIEAMLDRLDEIESDTDAQQVIIRKQIFALEKELPPIDCIYLYKAVEWTGALADRAQTAGGQLQILLANN